MALQAGMNEPTVGQVAPVIITSEGVFCIGGSGFVCQIIEPVTFARLYLHCGISHWADI